MNPDRTDESLFDAHCSLLAAQRTAPDTALVAAAFDAVRATLDFLDAVLRAAPEYAPEWADRDAQAEAGG